MKLIITTNGQAFADEAAKAIISQIRRKPDSVIGLSTGRTTGDIHRLIASIHRDRSFDVSGVTFFGQDEVSGVPRDYSGSCWTMLKTELIDSLGTDEDHFLMLPVRSDDYARDCRMFMEEIGRRGGIDLLVLGIGENGHLGFNQPGTPFASGCRVSVMTSELESRIRRETGIPKDVELGGVTIGLRDVMSARRILAVANGLNKADIMKKIIEGPVTEDVPASILQLHPDCEFILDNDAASKLNKPHDNEQQ